MMRLRSLVLLTAGVFLIGTHSGYAQSRPCDVVVHVNSVLASQMDEPVDPQLKELRHKLQMLGIIYKTYHLESHRDGETRCGKMIEFTLPGGHILHVQPREIDGEMIDMDLVLFVGARPMMTTDFKLHNNGTLILGGQRYEQGMLIITVGATVGPEPPAHPTATPTATAGSATPAHPAATPTVTGAR